jgi:hypothetical protein
MLISRLCTSTPSRSCIWSLVGAAFRRELQIYCHQKLKVAHLLDYGSVSPILTGSYHCGPHLRNDPGPRFVRHHRHCRRSVDADPKSKALHIRTYGGHYLCAENQYGGEVNTTRNLPHVLEIFRVMATHGYDAQRGSVLHHHHRRTVLLPCREQRRRRHPTPHRTRSTRGRSGHAVCSRGRTYLATALRSTCSV